MNIARLKNSFTSVNLKPSYLLFIIIGILFLSYWGVLHNGFIYDDHELIEQSSLLRPETPVSDIFKQSFFEEARGKTGYYRPITILSYKVDYAVFGLNPAGFHLSSLILHILCVLMFFLFLRNTGVDLFAASVAVLIFGLSPFRVQSVAWISARSDILATLFLLLVMINFRQYRKNRNREISLFLIGAFSLLSFLSKEISMVIPALIFIYDYFFLEKSSINLKQKYLPYLVIFSVAVIYLTLRYNALGVLLSAGRSPESWWVPADGHLSRLLTVPQILGWYLYKNIVPWSLSFDRGISGVTSLSNIWFFVSFVIIIVWVIVIAKTGRKYKYITLGLFWFLLSLLPISNIFPIFESTMEHFSYLPSIGFAIAASAVLFHFGKKRKVIMYCFLFAVLLTWGFFTHQRVKAFRSDLTIFADSVQKNPNSYRANGLYGIALSQAGKHAASIHWFERAVKIMPDFPRANYNLGISYKKAGRFEEAERSLRKAISLDPKFLPAYHALGNLYLFLQKSSKARDVFIKMTELNSELQIVSPLKK